MKALELRIREEYRLYVAFATSASHCDGAESTTRGRRLELAMRHRRRAGRLLVQARRAFDNEQAWGGWLKRRCKVSARAAIDLMSFAA